MKSTRISKMYLSSLLQKFFLLGLIIGTYQVTSCSRKINSKHKSLNNNVTIGAVLSTSNVVNFDKVNQLGELLNREPAKLELSR